MKLKQCSRHMCPVYVCSYHGHTEESLGLNWGIKESVGTLSENKTQYFWLRTTVLQSMFRVLIERAKRKRREQLEDLSQKMKSSNQTCADQKKDRQTFAFLELLSEIFPHGLIWSARGKILKTPAIKSKKDINQSKNCKDKNVLILESCWPWLNYGQTRLIKL